MFPSLELLQTGEFRVLARPSRFAQTQSKSSKTQSVSRQERKNLEFKLREEAPPLPSQPRHPTTVTIRAVEVASTGARFRQVVAYIEVSTHCILDCPCLSMTSPFDLFNRRSPLAITPILDLTGNQAQSIRVFLQVRYSYYVKGTMV
jgi:hypothetical protein